MNIWRYVKNSIMKKSGHRKRVFVGVSGGVDSSVSAALLLEQGYDVTGVFIRTWTPEWLPCTWRSERRDAMRVCAHLNIPFIELDLTAEYKQGVADYMISEYAAGRTPNPDVMCNREVKFGGFLSWALAHGADYVATGHYAQNIDNQLVKGNDPSKDQSYFLWTLSHEQLEHVLFPIGHLPKSAVRELALQYKLPTAVKKDSQGICFIGQVDMKEFLKHYIDVTPGDVLDTQGRVIGNHEGAVLYTLGERHGFMITDKGTDDKPYYVINKDFKHNTITVSQNPLQETRAKQKKYELDHVIIRDENILEYCSITAQIRYHGDQKDCEISISDNVYFVKFLESDYTLAPGQSVVLYHHDTCIGGGIVK
jgi:tRNA-specific 2-thiouridylase